ncbi:2-oxoacid:acceptor oxidoreductase subunit alpha [Vibrio sp. S4M6]|uniref:2-oxoacid:acceptor oxidoreductase subunit alpha n=1 Tax=Vibrio sinus TaxID=2946865 RepID=UPI00202A03B7|nr:2-oxoacid:acceptor oxidoreductase subunit alpha [Vibrio sinus]MCL9779822.1 2-oxoacid:acceptor oxidoreductase subunit alpha [Vibrio sinus]
MNHGNNPSKQSLDSEVIRFAGDSGDGIQFTGDRFSSSVSLFGNSLATLPDYPAEIRAPAGTVSGVSSFQLQFADHDIYTPGDRCGVLIAMNAAALKKNLADLNSGGLLIIDKAGFRDSLIKLAGFNDNPLNDGSLKDYRVIAEDFTQLTLNSLEGLGLPGKIARRCKNCFMLGIALWIFSQTLEEAEAWIAKRFASSPEIVNANITALKSGFNYADTTEIFGESWQIGKADIEPGRYRSVSGNEALSLGFVTASLAADKSLFLGSYPITPASDILHQLAKYQHYGVTTFQAEDEIAAAGAALGASYAGALGITTTSGPGLCLKSETINLAVMTELPLVVVDVQRGGPSTGLPTKTEQSDLLFALYGRNGDSPLPVIAASSPGDCYAMAIEACRIATTFMTPVILLTDGYIANGTESWKVPSEDELPSWDKQEVSIAGSYYPYLRDHDTLAREWVVPGTEGKEHRIGGLEKQSITGDVCYEPSNHQKMTHERATKISNISRFIPKQTLLGSETDDMLVLSWGGTLGSVKTAINELRESGHSVAHSHLQYLNPLPSNFTELLGKFNRILVVELNNGQLKQYVQSQVSVPVEGFAKTDGTPFKIEELTTAIKQNLKEKANEPTRVES